MTHNRENRTPVSTPTAGIYERPRVTVIGEDSRVILGVPGGGDDYFGFSFPIFEFESDGVDTSSNE
jgi:hypothetical protein